MFHVKHLHLGRQNRQLVGRMLALERHPHALRRQRAGRPLGEIDQRGKGARADHVKRLLYAFDPRMQAGQVGQFERQRGLLDESGFFCHRIDAGDGHRRATNRDHHAGQARARADIKQAAGAFESALLQVAAQRRDSGQAVEQVMRHHFGRVAHGGQVIDLRPFGDQGLVIEKLLDLQLAQFQLQGLQSGQQRGAQIQIHRHHSAPGSVLLASTVFSGTVFFHRFFFRCTSSSDTVAGVMP